MKTCTQISDSGFRRKIYVASAGDSAKRASPGRGGCLFLHVNTPLQSSLHEVNFVDLKISSITQKTLTGKLINV